MIRLSGYLSKVKEMLAEQDCRVPVLTRCAITPKWVVVQAEECCGIGFGFFGEHAVHGNVAVEPMLALLNSYIGHSLDEVMSALAERDDILSRAFYVASFNALTNPLCSIEALRQRGYAVSSPKDLSFIESDDKVVLIGYGMLINEVIERCGKVHICDMRPLDELQTVFIDGSIRAGSPEVILHTADEDMDVLKDADVVIASACTLINDTWTDLFRWSEKARIKGFYGPSGGIPPEIISDMGLNYLLTTHVFDVDKVFSNIRRSQMEMFASNAAQNYSILI